MISDSEGTQARTARYTCFDYRREMMLAGLKRRLGREDLNEAQKAEIECAIADLEKEIGLD